MDYRYSHHVPDVQTSATVWGESCQEELCGVSFMSLQQHNEKTGYSSYPITAPPPPKKDSHYFLKVIPPLFIHERGLRLAASP